MITLSKSGSTVTFTFDENSGYLQNGTIDVPVNSLALITDESDMATFRKSASNDIFVSARYEEFGMSKAELEAWYKANMVGSTGGGGGVTSGEVQTMIDESISGKADTSAVTEEISAAVSGKADTTAVTESIAAAVSGKVDTTAFTAFSGDVQSTLDEIETVAGAAFNDINDRIDAIGGGCEVSATSIYDKYYNYYYYGGVIKYTSAVFDYTEDKTQAGYVQIHISVRDDNYNFYFNQYVVFDYIAGTYTLLGDESEAQYLDIVYDSTIEDFKIAVASSIQSVAFINDIQNFYGGYVLMSFYTIESGSPCTIIENDIPQIVEKTRDTLLNSIKLVNFNVSENNFSLEYYRNNGVNEYSAPIRLEELYIDNSDGNTTMKPNIQVGLGTSGWTEISYIEGQCEIRDLKSTIFKVTYDSNFDPSNGMYLQVSFNFGNNMSWDYINYDSENDTVYGTIDSITTAATYEWSASTKELVITYPATVEYGGEILDVNIPLIVTNCQLGFDITKFETYGELTQPLKPYVQETKAALGGLKLQQITQSDYDNLQNKDASTLYVIVN